MSIIRISKNSDDDLVGRSKIWYFWPSFKYLSSCFCRITTHVIFPVQYWVIWLALAVSDAFLIPLGFYEKRFPYNLTYIIRRHYPLISEIQEFQYISIACHWLAMSHCFYNPVIYIFVNSSFKKAFKDVYVKICCSFRTEIDEIDKKSKTTKYFSNFTKNRASSSSVSNWKNFYSKISMTKEMTPKVSIISSRNIVSHDPRAGTVKVGFVL